MEDARVKTLEEPKPVKVDLTYLCPNDPNRDKIIEAGGIVMPEDGPLHLGGYIAKTEDVEEKKYTYDPQGRRIEYKITHKIAFWVCQTTGCDGKLTIDPYGPYTT